MLLSAVDHPHLHSRPRHCHPSVPLDCRSCIASVCAHDLSLSAHRCCLKRHRHGSSTKDGCHFKSRRAAAYRCSFHDNSYPTPPSHLGRPHSGHRLCSVSCSLRTESGQNAVQTRSCLEPRCSRKRPSPPYHCAKHGRPCSCSDSITVRSGRGSGPCFDAATAAASNAAAEYTDKAFHVFYKSGLEMDYGDVEDAIKAHRYLGFNLEQHAAPLL